MIYRSNCNNSLGFVGNIGLFKFQSTFTSRTSRICTTVRIRHHVRIKAIADSSSRTELKNYVLKWTSASDREIERMTKLLDTKSLKVAEVWLLFAARVGDADAVKTLLDAGADVNISDAEGSTPLMRAISRGHDDTVKVILNAPGMDITRKNSKL